MVTVVVSVLTLHHFLMAVLAQAAVAVTASLVLAVALRKATLAVLVVA